MQPEHRAMYVVGSTSTTRPSSSQDTPRIRVAFNPRIFESNVVARMGERSPFVSSNRTGTPLPRVHLSPGPLGRTALRRHPANHAAPGTDIRRRASTKPAGEPLLSVSEQFSGSV